MKEKVGCITYTSRLITSTGHFQFESVNCFCQCAYCFILPLCCIKYDATRARNRMLSREVKETNLRVSTLQAELAQCRLDFCSSSPFLVDVNETAYSMALPYSSEKQQMQEEIQRSHDELQTIKSKPRDMRTRVVAVQGGQVGGYAYHPLTCPSTS